VSLSQIVAFALIGIGSGALISGVGLGVVLSYRGAGVINLAVERSRCSRVLLLGAPHG